ncbi:MAG: helix-turn-helix transcriptional regulator [Planctomycetota bacterium]
MGSVAESAGVNPSAMSRYINRGSRVPAEVVAPLAKALRVSIEWLVDDEQDWPPVWKNHRNDPGAAVARSPRPTEATTT